VILKNIKLMCLGFSLVFVLHYDYGYNRGFLTIQVFLQDQHEYLHRTISHIIYRRSSFLAYNFLLRHDSLIEVNNLY